MLLSNAKARQMIEGRNERPRTASSVETRFLAAERAAVASEGFSLKFLESAIREGTVLAEPRKNLFEVGSSEK